MRPRLLVVVVGTGTEVGKTWVAAGLARVLGAQGLHVAARKPAQSFEPGDALTDADVLGAATGEDPETVCPRLRWYPAAMAPPMAADVLDLTPPTLADLAAEVTAGWPDPAADIGLVEGAGGVASPLGVDGDNADLAVALAADQAVLVADAGLGVISAVRLASRALAPRPTLVHLNRFDPDAELHRRNLAWLRDRDGLMVTTDLEDLAGRLGPPVA